ncbi:hypothetical protein [Asanoa siamensis]|uniref:Uncharacterized protein n=1 Tax=Asanoa siamensis TaxID=926357 RepID=A0ABQ4CWI3_9ACTN|nr:hypothetical protein [Asanoa siamensis]GIF75654.1 hypothetical protein Asi02nite_51720 [Asanoa siamensis]
MVSKKSGRGRHTSAKNAARALAAEAGISYTEALRRVSVTGEVRQPRHRWILTDDVRAWFAGQGWRGVRYPDLFAWLDNDVSTAYDCDWCGESGDARTGDSSISLVIAAYDPDLSPVTAHLATYKYHAACKPSSVAWAHQVDIPAGPQRVALPASAAPEMVSTIELDGRPLVYADDEEQVAVLLLTAAVVDDLRQGAAPWLTELRMFLRQHGFGRPGDLTGTTGRNPVSRSAPSPAR